MRPGFDERTTNRIANRVSIDGCDDLSSSDTPPESTHRGANAGSNRSGCSEYYSGTPLRSAGTRSTTGRSPQRVAS